MKLVLAFALGALLLPAEVQARTSSSEVAGNASRQCSALRVEIGPSTFGGTFSSFAACVLKLTPLEQQNTAAADTLCRVRFPAPSSPLRLFESCVVTFAKSASLTEQQFLNPARTCTSLRSSIGTAAFAGAYGSGGDTANSFGTCVSTTARARLAVETSAASACRAAQEAGGFASAHGGRTFARFYGTNAGASNAFGRCVSLKARAQASPHAGQTSTSTAGQQVTPQPSSTTTTAPTPTDATSTSTAGQQVTPQPSSTTTTAPTPTDANSTSTAGQQSSPQPSSTTATAPTSTDPCSGGSGKPNRLMPSDCLPAGPAGGLR